MFPTAFDDFLDPRVRESFLPFLMLVGILLGSIVILTQSTGTDSNAATFDRNDSATQAHSAAATNSTSWTVSNDCAQSDAHTRTEQVDSSDDEASETGGEAAEVTVNALTTKIIDFATTSNDCAQLEAHRRTEHAVSGVEEEQAGEDVLVETSGPASISNKGTPSGLPGLCHARESVEEAKASGETAEKRRGREFLAACRRRRERLGMVLAEQQLAERRERELDEERQLAEAERERQLAKERDARAWHLSLKARCAAWDARRAAEAEEARRAAEAEEEERRRTEEALEEDRLYMLDWLRAKEAQQQCPPPVSLEPASTVRSTRSFRAAESIASSRPATNHTSPSGDGDEG